MGGVKHYARYLC